MAKTKRPFESVTGRYTPMPDMLVDSAAFMGASHRTRSLILELARQHNGINNGHLHLATSWLKKRGWASTDGIQKAKVEALERGLIIKTRQGGLNIGPDRYALTWLPISNFVGLEITQKEYHPGAYLLMSKLPMAKGQVLPPPVRNSAKRTVQRTDHSAERNGAVPHNGMSKARAVPPNGTKMSIFGAPTVPPDGNNELLPPTKWKMRRVVGVPGRSGKPRAAIIQTNRDQDKPEVLSLEATTPIN